MTYQEDVCAEFEDAVHTGKLLKHDGVTDSTEELTDKLPNHQHHRRIQAHDAVGKRHNQTERDRCVSLFSSYNTNELWFYHKLIDVKRASSVLVTVRSNVDD